MVQTVMPLEEHFDQLAINQRDRSSTLFTNYEPGFEGTEMIHGRIFAPAHYGEEYRYFLPIDGNEYPREELTNALWSSIAEPVRPDRQTIPQGIFLDLGTDFGLWAQDASFVFPTTDVIGVDLHYTHTPTAFDNCSFEVDNYELPLTRDKPIALVHLRESGFSIRNFQKVACHIFSVLCNGGWFQNEELRLQNWIGNKPMFNSCDHTLMGARNLGIQLHSEQTVQSGLREAGFCNYAEQKIRWRTSQTDIGRTVREVVKLTVIGSVRILAEGTTGLDVTVPKFVDAVLKELEEEDCEVVIEACLCVAQKGFEAV